MVKKGYYGNEGLGLAWDCIEVRQMNPFCTTTITPLNLFFQVNFRLIFSIG